MLNPEINNPYSNQDEDGELEQELYNDPVNYLGGYDPQEDDDDYSY